MYILTIYIVHAFLVLPLLSLTICFYSQLVSLFPYRVSNSFSRPPLTANSQSFPWLAPTEPAPPSPATTKPTAPHILIAAPCSRANCQSFPWPATPGSLAAPSPPTKKEPTETLKFQWVPNISRYHRDPKSHFVAKYHSCPGKHFLESLSCQKTVWGISFRTC